MEIRPERTGDHHPVGEVHRLAFGRGDEASLVNALRAGGYSRISLVAGDGDAVVAHALFSALSVGDRAGALALAPVAVVPGHQGKGIGSALIREGLLAAGKHGYGTVFVLGPPGYYRRFGFRAKPAEGLAPYSGEAFMVLELVPGALEGVSGKIEYPPPFGALSA